MVSNRPLERLTKTNITATSTGSVLITTTENGTEKFHPLFIVFTCSAINGLVTLPTISVGTNSSSYNNILIATVLTGVVSANTMLKLDMTTATGIIDANTNIYLRITSAAVASSMTIDAHLFGYYQ